MPDPHHTPYDHTPTLYLSEVATNTTMMQRHWLQTTVLNQRKMVTEATTPNAGRILSGSKVVW